MILYCIRHGESQFNADGRIQGQLDVPLSPLGKRQALALAEALAPLPLTAIYASPLARAAQTAAAIARRLELPVNYDDRLREIHAGIFQGLLWSEIREQYPDLAELWLAQEPDFVIPQGESRRALAARGLAALEDLRAAGHQQLAIVAHGGLLTATFKALLGVPAERSPFALFNASISQARWDRQFRLVTLNQTEHLRGLDDAPLSAGDLVV